MSTAQFLERNAAKKIIESNHYLKIFPTGWTRSYQVGSSVIVFSIPANRNLEPFLFSKTVGLRELARLWAPDHHQANDLTSAIAAAVKALRADSPQVGALVSFADPNVGHHGGVYQAASWVYTGQSSESRGYLSPDGRIVARRAFHSNGTSRVPDLPVVKRQGKLRYVKPITSQAKRCMRRSACAYPKPNNIKE